MNKTETVTKYRGQLAVLLFLLMLPGISAAMNIGGAGTGYLNCTVDSIRIYNRSLSAEEIRLSYGSRISRQNSTHWEFFSNISDEPDAFYTYRGWANDSAGNENSTEIRTLAIDTTNPTVSVLSPPNLTQSPNDYVFINASVTDATNISTCWLTFNTTNYTMTKSENGSSISCTYNLTGLPQGNHSFLVYANDSASNIGNTGNITYIHNTPPNITSPQLSVSATDIDAICTAVFSDADGDPETLYYDWFINGVLSYTYINTTILDDSLFQQGDIILCQMTPYDGFENGTPRNSTSKEVGPKSAVGGGGGGKFDRVAMTTVPQSDRPFVVMPRAIDPDRGDIPASITLGRNGSAKYEIVSWSGTNRIMRIYAEGYKYELPSGYAINSKDMLTFSPTGTFNLEAGESVTLSVMSKLPPDARGEYMVDLFVISDNYTEVIYITLDGGGESRTMGIAPTWEEIADKLGEVLWEGDVPVAGRISIFWWELFPMFAVLYLGNIAYQKKKENDKLKRAGRI